MNDLQFMPHQEEVLNLTDDKNRCAYYLDMGLGKTFVGAEKMYLLNNTVNLIVCQKSKVDDWVDHMKTYYPEYRVMDLTKKTVSHLFSTKQGQWVVTIRKQIRLCILHCPSEKGLVIFGNNQRNVYTESVRTDHVSTITYW